MGANAKNYLALAMQEGFEEALKLPFQGAGNVEEHLYILFHPKDAVLLVFETFNGQHLGGVDLCYNWRYSQDGKDISKVISSGNLSHKDPTVWIGRHESCEDIGLQLARLRAHGSFVTPWVERPFLWLLTHTDTKIPNYSASAINEARVAMLPQHVRNAISPKK